MHRLQPPDLAAAPACCRRSLLDVLQQYDALQPQQPAARSGATQQQIDALPVVVS